MKDRTTCHHLNPVINIGIIDENILSGQRPIEFSWKDTVNALNSDASQTEMTRTSTSISTDAQTAGKCPARHATAADAAAAAPSNE